MNGIVIRPGCVYGKQGGLTGLWFDGAVSQDSFTVVGDGHNHRAMVHVEDLADAYLRVVEKKVKGEVFDITDGSHHTVGEMVKAIAKATGTRKEILFQPLTEALKEMGDFAEALAIDQKIDSSKAQQRLDWQPKHHGFVEDIDLYLEAWKNAAA